MVEDLDLPIRWRKDKQWIIVEINIDNKQLVIENNKLKIE